MRIDFHAHFLDAGVLEEAGAHNVASGFGARPLAPPPGSRFAEIHEKMLDPDLHVADLDRLGIDRSVISATLVLTSTSFAQPRHALDMNRRLNDTAARWVARHPDRLIGSFTLPLQDLDLALGELERASGELGLRVVNLPAQVRGTYLGAPALRPLWDAIAQHDLIALIHPDGVADPWFQEYSLWNSVGQPLEEAKVLASLIYEGVLEQLPGLRIVVSHGGGYLPHYYGRLDRNVHNMPDSARNITLRPSEYLRRLYYDTCLYEPAVLSALVDRVGADRLVMGSDYPVGEADPVGFVERCDRLDDDARAAVLGTTAAGLLGL
ncbi:MAG TPA: amidohydrolase family protein [Solirubrobacteraceae bacterium]|nr:amidohydrolase family protein [Solirubrobacteraceae bacterium]